MGNTLCKKAIYNLFSRLSEQHHPWSPISDASPTSTYSFVRPHSGPNRSTEARSKALPESLYAQVEIHPRS